MTWITTLLRRPTEVLEPAPAPVAAPTGPDLVLLVPDIAGISSFRRYAFPDATSAADFAGQIRPEVRRGVIAFWALHERPDPAEDTRRQTSGEVLVLMRAAADSELFYVVSFINLECASAFVRLETKRGLDPANVSLYWAGVARLREEIEGVSLIPGSPPLRREREEIINGVVDLWAALETIEGLTSDVNEPQASVAVAEPPAAADTPLPQDAATALEEAEDVAGSALERLRGELGPQVEALLAEAAAETVIPEQFRLVQPNVQKPAEEDEFEFVEREGAPEAMAASAAEAAVAPVIPEPFRLVGPSIDDDDEDESGWLAPVHEDETGPVEAPHFLGAAEPDASLLLEAITLPLTEAPETETNAAPQPELEPDPEGFGSGTVVAFAGDEELAVRAPMRTSRPKTIKPRQPRRVINETRSAHKATRFDEFDVAYEAARLLKIRRWEQLDEPFEGFKSPPGKF